jgi:hypothetical protein
MTKPLRVGVLVVTAIAVVAACASTWLDSVYVAPDYGGGAFDRLMIVGLAPTEGGRAHYENAFADRLSALGATGIASSNVFPSQEELSRERVAAWVREHGIRGALVTRVEDVKREQRYVPPTSQWDLYGYYGYWGSSLVSSPGYVVEETTVILETSLFDASDGKLVYTAMSKSFQPSSREEIVREVVEALTEDLQERGLLERRPGS